MSNLPDSALRDSLKFDALLEAAPDGFVIIDDNGRILLVNSQTERLFGYDRRELIDQRVEMLVPERFRVGHVGHRLGYQHEPRVRPMGAGVTLFGRRKDGSEFPVEISLSPLNTEKGRLVTAVVRDVTDRKRIERALQEKNLELETANVAKDRFLAGMSHELRTPLNAILGFTGTLLMELPGALNAEQTSQLQTIKSSARHLLALVDDLLDLAKIESGTVDVRLETVDCAQVLTDVESAVRPAADGKGLRLEVDARTRPLVARSDKRALTQILMNLATNAVKFTESGSVRLTAARVGDAVQLTVADTGVGIAPDDADRLFQSFVQLDTTAARRHEGSGLGLYLSRKLADLIGGTISVESDIGRGSTFTLTVPPGDSA